MNPSQSTASVLPLNPQMLDLLPAAVDLCDAEGVLRYYNRRAADLWGRGAMFAATVASASPALPPLPARRLAPGPRGHPDGRRAANRPGDAGRRDRHGATGRLPRHRDDRERGDPGRRWPHHRRHRRPPGHHQAKRHFEELRRSEERFRRILAALPAAVYTTDQEGRITFVNAAAAELWGRLPDIGKEMWCGSFRMFRPDGTPLPHDQCPMAVALREGRSVPGQEIVVERSDGTRVCVLPHPVPLAR